MLSSTVLPFESRLEIRFCALRECIGKVGRTDPQLDAYILCQSWNEIPDGFVSPIKFIESALSVENPINILDRIGFVQALDVIVP